MLSQLCKVMLIEYRPDEECKMSPIWLPPQGTADPLALILPNLFHLQNSPINSTIIRLKQYLKKSKAINPSSTRTGKKTLKRGIENAQQMDSKDPKSGKIFKKPEARVYPIGKNTQKFDVMHMVSKKQQQSFVEKLADQIEAAEVERLASEIDNPLKYTVKDGILYKKNKIPIARIRFPSMNMPPLTADRIQKVIRTEHTNAVLNTPPMFSKRSALGNSVNQTANVFLKPEHKKPITPLSSAPIRFWRDKAKASSAIGFDIDDGIQQVTVVPSFVGFSTNLMEESRGLHSNGIIDKIRKPPPYPFSHCYMNVDG
uniref:SKIP_SNW domain-containing protein n=1 Tax=Angiostrongylus cantonensis TaxID=6313 RepID=A0A0K0D2A7_ANGCA